MKEEVPAEEEEVEANEEDEGPAPCKNEDWGPAFGNGVEAMDAPAANGLLCPLVPASDVPKSPPLPAPSKT